MTHQPNRYVELGHVPAIINTTAEHKIKVAPVRKTGTILVQASANLPSRMKQKHPSIEVPLKIQAKISSGTRKLISNSRNKTHISAMRKS